MLDRKTSFLLNRIADVELSQKARGFAADELVDHVQGDFEVIQSATEWKILSHGFVISTSPASQDEMSVRVVRLDGHGVRGELQIYDGAAIAGSPTAFIESNGEIIWIEQQGDTWREVATADSLDDLAKRAMKLAEANYDSWGQWVVETMSLKEVAESLAEEGDDLNQWVELRKSIAGVFEDYESTAF